MLEAGEADLALENGRVRVAGTDRSVALGRDRDAARRVLRGGAAEGRRARPRRPRATSRAAGSPSRTAANACEVEVDAATGEVKILRYVVAHDCGRLINPLLVDGQIEGGVVHGIGNALHEHMAFDAEAQPVTTNYADYLLPVATDLPPIEVIHLESPSPLNPLGVKGAGEGGTIPATACVISAIEDALAAFGVTLNEHPVSPQRIVELIGRAKRHVSAASLSSPRLRVRSATQSRVEPRGGHRAGRHPSSRPSSLRDDELLRMRSAASAEATRSPPPSSLPASARGCACRCWRGRRRRRSRGRRSRRCCSGSRPCSGPCRRP